MSPYGARLVGGAGMQYNTGMEPTAGRRPLTPLTAKLHLVFGLLYVLALVASRVLG